MKKTPKKGRPATSKKSDRMKVTIDLNPSVYGHLATIRDAEGRSFGRIIDGAFLPLLKNT